MEDPRTASREALLAEIARQQGVIVAQREQLAELEAALGAERAVGAEQRAELERQAARVKELEAQLAKSVRRRMPGLKAAAKPSDKPKEPRKPRERGAGRRRQSPTDYVLHALDTCPDCGGPLEGGEARWSRQVLEVEQSPVEVIEHVFIERRCRQCGRSWTPSAAAELGGVVLGKQRLGVGLVSLIANLREEGRLPVRTIQWYLRVAHELKLGVGTIVEALHRVARQGEAAAAAILERVRASPAVHADETGWRENGQNGYGWSFTTRTERYYLRRGRNKEVVDEVLGEDFSGVLLSDFYAAYDHYEGLHQRCWVHLLRDIHELTEQHPRDEALQAWAKQVHAVYLAARAFASPDVEARIEAKRGFEATLVAVCQPYQDNEQVPQRVLCGRIRRYLDELLVFVVYPEVPSDNNAAERSMRHLVTARKISGGTRSEQGTKTKMTLATLFGTWRVRGLDSYQTCRQLLGQSQV